MHLPPLDEEEVAVAVLTVLNMANNRSIAAREISLLFPPAVSILI
jgi:hypothetical protein